MRLSYAPVALALASAAITAGLVEVARRASLHFALLDLPNRRSSHVIPTPRLGGVACACVLLAGLVGIALMADVGAEARHALLVVAVAGLAIATVSLIDDLRPLHAGIRLLVHLAAAVAIAATLGGITVIDAGPLGRLPLLRPWSDLLAIVWIAGFVNAFNFMDGIDGIAGGQALVAGLGWCLMGALAGAPALVLAGALLSGTSLGFLVHNWSPARIFMGDAGSVLLGLLLATIPWTAAPSSLWLPSTLLLWPFVFDTSFTLVRRIARRERIWEAHRSHLYQRMVINGASHARVAALYALLACVGGVSAALALGTTPVAFTMTLGALALSALGLWRLASLPARRAS